jgi:hypothetical protein
MSALGAAAFGTNASDGFFFFSGMFRSLKQRTRQPAYRAQRVVKSQAGDYETHDGCSGQKATFFGVAFTGRCEKLIACVRVIGAKKYDI